MGSSRINKFIAYVMAVILTSMLSGALAFASDGIAAPSATYEQNASAESHVTDKTATSEDTALIDEGLDEADGDTANKAVVAGQNESATDGDATLESGSSSGNEITPDDGTGQKGVTALTTAEKSSSEPATTALAPANVDDEFNANIDVGGTSTSCKFKVTSANTVQIGNNGSPAISTSATGALTIPATVTYSGTTYDVTSLGSYCFRGCTRLTSTGLSGNTTLTSIGDNCFRGCSGLTSTGLSGNTTLTSIGGYCFRTCTGLTSTGLEANAMVTSLEDDCFYGCTGLTSTGLSDNTMVTHLGNECFSSCTSLTSTSLSNNTSMTSLGNDCFSGCTSLTDTGLSGNMALTSLGEYCFQSCTRLTDTGLSGNMALTSLGEYCFQSCTGLISTGLSGNTTLTTLGIGCFNDCTGLTSTGLSGNTALISIEDDCFRGCTGLTSTGLSGNTALTTLGNCCFYDCTSLTDTGLSGNTALTSLGVNCFHNCTSLTSTGLSGNTALTSLAKYCFRGCTGLASTGLETNETVTSIEDYCFRACTGLASTGLETNETVTSLGNYCFRECIGLASTGLETNETVTSLGNNCFWGCTSLIDAALPSSLTTCNAYVFRNCSNLKSVCLYCDLAVDLTDAPAGLDVYYLTEHTSSAASARPGDIALALATVIVDGGTQTASTNHWCALANTPSYGRQVEGDVVTIAADTSSPMKVFVRWNVESGNVTLADSMAASTTFTMGKTNVDVKAIYDYGVTYKVTGDVPDGYIVPIDDAVYAVGDTVTAANVPSVNGYTFAGWYLDGTVVASFDMPDKAVTLTGVWTKNVSPSPTPTANTPTPTAGKTTSETSVDSNTSTLAKTGDESGASPFLALLAACAGSTCLVLVARHRRGATRYSRNTQSSR